MERGYALKKNALRRWIYQNGYTQPQVASALHMSVSKFKRKLKERETFNEDQLRRLIYFMGARAAFRVIYFHTFAEREQVRAEAFSKRKRKHEQRKKS